MAFNILLVIKWNLGIEGVLISNLMASGFIFIASLPVVIKKIKLLHIRSEVAKNILSFALPFLPAGIFTMIMELSNRYMLEWFEGTHAVGLFSAGYKLGIFGLIIVMGFNMGWTPYFLKRVKEKDAKLDFSSIASLFLGFLGFVVVLVSLWSSEIVRFNISTYHLIGSNYWDSEKIIPIVLLGYFFFGTYIIQLPGVYSKKITKWVPIFRAIGAITNIFLNILLIPQYGIVGSACATAVAFLLMSLSIYVKLYKIYFVRYNWFALCYPVFFIVLTFFSINALGYRLAITVSYLLGWYYLALNNDERLTIKSLLS
jgi:O-antigen/teichoic acid export membrane protein